MAPRTSRDQQLSEIFGGEDKPWPIYVTGWNVSIANRFQTGMLSIVQLTSDTI